MAERKVHAKRLFKRRSFQVLLGLVLVLVAVRIALPFIIRDYVNDELAEMNGYWGRVQDVDVSLIRGAYRLEGIRIVKTDGRVPVPFFRARALDTSVEWGALLDGAIVAEVVVTRPQINFVNSDRRRGDQSGEGQDWRAKLKEIIPFKINSFIVRNGSLHFRDFDKEPQVNIYVQNIRLTITNLTNSEDLSRDFVASAHGSATAMRSGRVRMRARIDPYAERPTFDLWLSMQTMSLPEINSFLDGYAGIDAEAGTFSLYTELHSRNGRFRGYAKPIIEGAEIFDLGGEEEGFFTQAWEAIVALAMEVFTNQRSDPDRFATRIPLQGNIDEPNADVWTTMAGILKNAFIRALSHGLERSVPV